MKRLTYTSTFHFNKILGKINAINKVSSRMKPLTTSLKNKGGRSQGLIIAPRRGNLIKRQYRYIDFRRVIFPTMKGLVLDTLYDPSRTANLCLVCYPVGLYLYILQPIKVMVGDIIVNNPKESLNYGDSISLRELPSGALIHNIQAKFIRSAGCSAIFIRKDRDQALVKLKSGELRFFNTSVLASFGTIANENHFLYNSKKAGYSRYLGRRPRVRPSAMNPVDHPLGGRTRGGSFPLNSKGQLTVNRSTVKKHRSHILYTKRQLKLLRL